MEVRLLFFVIQQHQEPPIVIKLQWGKDTF